MIVMIAPGERAIVYRNALPDRWLEPGKHRIYAWGAEIKVQRLDIEQPSGPMTPELASLMPQGAGEELYVGPRQLALVRKDGQPAQVLGPGRYVLWQLWAPVQAELISTEPVLGQVPETFWPLMPASELLTVVVQPFERVLLYIDGALYRILSEGRYGVFQKGRQVNTVRVEMREREVQITGQEVMTSDKATIRLNLIVKYRVVDPERSVQGVVDLQQGLYSEAQLFTRRAVAGLTVDGLLERRGEATLEMLEQLQTRARSWGAEVTQIDIKDIVLPGEMKTLLNRVLEAEKQAAANLVLRREETAATRSLANTAKLLESNPTLLRLKELETWKEIASRVGQVTVVASGQQLLGQLSLSGG